MPNRLADVLSNHESNYLLPFLWQKGEEEPVIREEIARVFESGIRAVCVEARPHPDFYGPRWWRDMDIIMEEARARGMRVWLLDDDHFPTGHAAGKMVDAPDALRRRYLREHHVDALGPQPNASFLVGSWLAEGFPPHEAGEAQLVAAIAARRDPASNLLTGELLDVTSRVEDGVLYWDVPDGFWRVFFIISSCSGGSPHHRDYINMILPESVRVLIDAVYEPFYARYAADFGKTFAGFFSDEPGFYNDEDSFDYQSTVGKKGASLPWRADLLELLAARAGRSFRELLPLLWYEGGEQTALARFTFMDLVTRLYAEAFTNQLGDWCRARQVEYIGHIIEDNGAHTHLGPSAGHYFRALWGQDMAGIDIVLWQLVPGFDQGPVANVSGEGDGEFYHFGLAKLASSLAHVDPKKRGRAMCELFGAYGWREGLKLMKWMTDYLLVNGVNAFVPHAFSQAEFPDPDCPPHLYARGKNPQYRYYRELNHYTNRAAHLLSGGVHIAPAAVLYHAEAEWAGQAMPFQKVTRALLQAQIDCDVLPGDVLLEWGRVEQDMLRLGEETYRALAVPACDALPARLIDRLVALADAGLPLFFIDHLPAAAVEGGAAGAGLNRLAHHDRASVISLAALAGRIRALGLAELSLEGSQPYLRHYHVRHPALEVWMFANMHPYQAIETRVAFPASGPALVYDPFANQVAPLGQAKNGSLAFPLHLEPYESLFILSGPDTGAFMRASRAGEGVWSRQKAGDEGAWVVPGPWRISIAAAEQYPTFTLWQDSAPLADLSRPAALPAFSGTFRYETTFQWEGKPGAHFLELGEAYETAEAWLNGERVGLRICQPYRFEISAVLRQGSNTLVVDVTNTLAKAQRDFFSRYAPQEPSGLLGPVRIAPVH